MKNKLRFFAVLCAVVLCMTAFSVTAFAGGGDELPPEYEISDHTHTEETERTNTQTVTFDVVIHEEGSKTVTVGDKVWTIGNKPEQIGKVVNVNSYLHLRTGPSTEKPAKNSTTKSLMLLTALIVPHSSANHLRWKNTARNGF